MDLCTRRCHFRFRTLADNNVGTSTMANLRIGQIALSFHRASASYIGYLLEKLGHSISIQEAPHEEAFRLLQADKIDILISAWLPGSHGKYLHGMEDEVVELGVIYDPYCIWGVPEYADPALKSVNDLKLPNLAGQIDRSIHTINPGAGISRFSVEIMKIYRLEEQGFSLNNLTENEYFGYIETCILERKQFVMPLWHPHFLHFKYRFRELEEPLGLLRSRDQATILIRKAVHDQLDEATISELRSVHLGNQRVSALDHLLHVDGLDREEAISRMMAVFPDANNELTTLIGADI